MDGIATEVSLEGGFCTEISSEPFGLVIFGASGDLARRKLYPALFNLFQRHLLSERSFIVGFGRTPLSDDSFRSLLVDLFASHDPDANLLQYFLSRCFYIQGDYADCGSYTALRDRVLELENLHGTQGNRIFYLATPPSLFCPIAERLGECRLSCEKRDGHCRASVVVEKPFGADLRSALELDAKLHQLLAERQIYRMDHYMGKETVQNILMFRFANSVFEPLWNREYVDHIQITASESIGVEKRAGYFEQAGLLRDMFQNHLLQLLALVTMEPPLSFEADRVRDERVKLLRSIRPIKSAELDACFVRGQYVAGQIDGLPVPAYRDELGIAKDSLVETYVAAKLFIDNWRWQGVPFYIRSGKRMAAKTTEIAIVFKKVPYSIFTPFSTDALSHNVLVLNVQPEEAVSLTIQVKSPGPKLCMSSLKMQFRYSEVFGVAPPEAYQRLLLDCIAGDQTLFIRSDAMQEAWSLIAPVLEGWKESGDLRFYPAGSWGPQQADQLLQPGTFWRE